MSLKFILLAQGPIAKKLLTNLEQDRSFLNSHLLVGVIGDASICENVKNVWQDKDISLHHISEKNRDEGVLEDLIKRTEPDYILSIQYPWIIPSIILEMKLGRFLNLHNARLPDYRGHNAISHVILNGEIEHYITMHWMDAKVDFGWLVKEKSIPVKSNDTAFSLWERSATAATALLHEWFNEVSSLDDFPRGTKIEGEGRFYSRELDEYKKVPLGASMQHIERIARAFYFPNRVPAHLEYDGKKIYITPTWPNT